MLFLINMFVRRKLQPKEDEVFLMRFGLAESMGVPLDWSNLARKYNLLFGTDYPLLRTNIIDEVYEEEYEVEVIQSY